MTCLSRGPWICWQHMCGILFEVATYNMKWVSYRPAITSECLTGGGRHSLLEARGYGGDPTIPAYCLCLLCLR